MEIFAQVTCCWILIIWFVRIDLIPLIEFLTEWDYETEKS